MTAQVIALAPYLEQRRLARVYDPFNVVAFWLALFAGMAAVALVEWE
jgi:hypothetical protein